MREETVNRILSVEHNASELYEYTQQEAARILEEAKAEVALQRKLALTEAQQKATQTLSEGRQAADAQRAAIIARAGADAQNLETVSSRHFEDAVTLVLNRVTGRA
ncbi:MAG: hypothetical protein JXA21_12145 [Anaerolineae bacterium]|nr:hypothetical protein [Anaerolineae bacterium]